MKSPLEKYNDSQNWRYFQIFVAIEIIFASFCYLIFRLEITNKEKVVDKYEKSKMRVFVLKELSDIAREIFENSSEGMDGRELAQALLNSVYYRLESPAR